MDDRETKSVASPVGHSEIDDSALKGLVLTVCGKSGAGKTTLIGKITQSDEKVKPSPYKDTADFTTKKSKSGNFSVIDVPGLEPSKREEWKNILKQLAESDNCKVHLILLCIPVGSGHKFNDGNPDILKYMQSIFGKKVWEYCVVIFTFSNFTTVEGEEQIQYLNDYTKRLKAELKNICNDDLEVKSIFEQSPVIGHKTIYTIPAGYKEKDLVNPKSSQPWIIDIFDLLEKKYPKSEFDLAENQKWWKKIITEVSVIGGGGVVGTVGTGVGAAAKGVAAGAALGGAGVIVGSAVGAGVAYATNKYVISAKKEKKSEVKEKSEEKKSEVEDMEEKKKK